MFSFAAVRQEQPGALSAGAAKKWASGTRSKAVQRKGVALEEGPDLGEKEAMGCKFGGKLSVC